MWPLVLYEDTAVGGVVSGEKSKEGFSFAPQRRELWTAALLNFSFCNIVTAVHKRNQETIFALPS